MLFVFVILEGNLPLLLFLSFLKGICFYSKPQATYLVLLDILSKAKVLLLLFFLSFLKGICLCLCFSFCHS